MMSALLTLAVPRPRPLQIEYNSGLSEEDNEIFEDSVEAQERCADMCCAVGWSLLDRQDLGLPGHQKAVKLD